MTALERAQTYAAIFIGVGDKWPKFIPVDGAMRGDKVWIEGVEMRRIGSSWLLQARNGETCMVKPAGVKAS